MNVHWMAPIRQVKRIFQSFGVSPNGNNYDKLGKLNQLK